MFIVTTHTIPDNASKGDGLVLKEVLKLANLNEEKLLKLETAIEELKDEHKKCLTHFYLEKKSYEEVALMTGFDLNQVKSFIQNGKRNLKLILEKHSEFRL